MRGTYITASIIALLILGWLLSGEINQEDPVDHTTLAQANRERAAEVEDDDPTRVRARVIRAVPQVQQVVLRGRTENKRTVEVKAEIAGRVVERPVERGTPVAEGDALCRISTEDRQVTVEESKAALVQARIEHEASLRLKEKGFQSETAIAQAAARLAAAEAQVERARLDLERTNVRAPFAGIVEDVHLERGDYVTPGDACVTVVDMDPMLLVGRVSERQVADLEVGQNVTGELADGRQVEGPVTFIGQQADPDTRTYAVEVEIPNAEYTLRSGITTRLHVPVGRIMAHKISPALFALDDEGNVGVRTVNDERQVEYHLIDIVRNDVDGVWVSGLPEVTTLITVGQELVVEGQEVELSFEPAAEMPARAPAGEQGGPPASSQAGQPGRSEAMIGIAAKP